MEIKPTLAADIIPDVMARMAEKWNRNNKTKRGGKICDLNELSHGAAGEQCASR